MEPEPELLLQTRIGAEVFSSQPLLPGVVSLQSIVNNGKTFLGNYPPTFFQNEKWEFLIILMFSKKKLYKNSRSKCALTKQFFGFLENFRIQSNFL